MHDKTIAMLLAMLAMPAASAAWAADLDYRYARPLPPRPPIIVEQAPEIDEAPPPRIYTRPVVGFYGYPYDYLEHAPRSAYRPGPHPYMYAEPPGPVDPVEYGRYPAPVRRAPYGGYPAPTYDFH